MNDIPPTVLVSPDEARKIAAEAYVYAYAPLFNYKTLFQQTQDSSFPGYIGGFGKFRHYARGFRPEDTDIVTPSNDTPYSWAWLDLRAEPVVVSVPAVPNRYYVLQWFDMYTHNFAFVGSRATGVDAGNYLFAGPGWHRDIPNGITEVFRSETDIIGTLTRTAWTGPEEQEALQSVQRRYRLRALSEFAGSRPPAPAPALSLAAARGSTYSLTLSADTSPHVELYLWRGEVEAREEPREDLGVTGDLDRVVLLQRVPGRAP